MSLDERNPIPPALMKWIFILTYTSCFVCTILFLLKVFGFFK